MSITTIGLIAAIVWVALLILVVALCRVAAHADAVGDRVQALLR